jgi:outer membrane protein
MKKLIFIAIFLLGFFQNSFAENSYFIDFSKVLNNSKPGAEAQKQLKQKFVNETKRLSKIEEDIKKEESKIISEKKTLSTEEYQKKINDLRKKLLDFQKNKQNSFNNIAKSRSDAKQALIKAVNPIIKKYMEDNKIRLIFDKQSVIMGDTNLEITDQIIVILNKELSSLKIN